MPDNAILTMKGITKVFPGVKALSSVDFTLNRGEVHALMGQNGAGKSTLIKVLTGVYKLDFGEIFYDGKSIKPESPQHIQKIGINTVYQEVNLCPNLSVAENIFIGREMYRYGFLNWKEMKKKSEEILREKLDLNIDVSKLLSSYSIAIQQMVAIARALNISSKVLILDEPTSSLDENEVKKLFDVINRLKNDGLGIIFVTHFLDQTYEISDRITILRNGELVGVYECKDLPKIELITKMIGKEFSELEHLPENKEEKVISNEGKNIIEVKNFGKEGYMNPFNFKINKGQIVGLAGLLGSGRTEMAKLLFGIIRSQKGEYLVNEKAADIHSPRNAIDNKLAFCPEDRKTEGIIDDLSVRENIILALQGSMGLFKSLSKKKQESIANEYIKLLNIKTPDANQPIKYLSGGNQQKVILARWLVTKPDMLILDEPTRGIDVGAKAEIQKIIMSISKEGMAVIFISSELDEVLRVSDRIDVLRDRYKITELDRHNVDESKLLDIIAL